jgi:AcrR family transcriptional regulator
LANEWFIHYLAVMTPRALSPEVLDRLLEAATEVFGRNGLKAAKMADIAAAAGVAVGTVYNYVEGKDALFWLLVTQGAGQRLEVDPHELPVQAPAQQVVLDRLRAAVARSFDLPALDQALTQQSAEDAGSELRAIVEELYDRTAATRRQARLLERSAVDLPELFQVFFVETRRGLLERLRRYLGARMRAGQLRPVADPLVAARYLVEVVTVFARHRHFEVDSHELPGCRPPPHAGAGTAAPRARDDAVTLAGSLVLVAGLFADGVVHNRAGSDLESFLTVPTGSSWWGLCSRPHGSWRCCAGTVAAAALPRPGRLAIGCRLSGCSPLRPALWATASGTACSGSRPTSRRCSAPPTWRCSWAASCCC